MQRPGGVTFSCVLSIVLGSLGILFGAIAFFAGALIGSLFGDAFGVLGAGIGMVIGFVPLAMGILGIVAGAQGLKGASWARWTMVVLYGLGALSGLASFPFGILTLGLTVAGLVLLVTKPANDWYAQHATRSFHPS